METTVPLDETWRLEDIYADDAAFLAARRELEAVVPTLDRWRGRLAGDPAVLADALDVVTDAYRRFASLRCYASLRSDRDTRIAANHARRQQLDLLAAELSSRLAYLRPEILAAEPRMIEQAIVAEPRLAPHAFFLRDLMRQRQHVLGPSEERLLSHASLMGGSADALYNVLYNAELPRPELRLSDGQTVRLTPVNFHVHRSAAERRDRLRIFPAYFGAYASFQDTLGQNLFNAVKAHLFRVRSRGYDSCLAAALDGNNIPVVVYRNLIEQVRRRFHVMHDYFRLRAEALGLERLEYPDIYCPITRSRPPRFTSTEARRVVRESLAPLGARYTAAVDRAFGERWLDWHPAPGKRSGAYATGWAYDVHPYVLLNFTGDYESVSTLTHEMGHAIHSHMSNAAQPFATADYPIFVAEVASTLNETLLSRHLFDRAADRDERLFLLGSQLDGFRGTLFRQTMFAEFELAIHEQVERGEVLTGESLNATYLALLRDYHGHDDGVVHIGDEYALEWATVPHFYYDFYVFQYATGIVAASALADAVLAQGAPAVERYLAFLAAGGSDYALDLLREAGVDLESADPYDATFATIERQVGHARALLGDR
ncbi:MAG TPA: M3 family oligoendopeptidase [Candidatus Polarisedimenticolaceae bacterium]|nr:M3 family oligoendopeptidase [Candidatus Polarisedimenticolaceae bacterium]